MREPDLKIVKKGSNKLEIDGMIARLDELIPQVGAVDRMSENLLITAKTILWAKMQLHGHPCNGCRLKDEITRLATR